MKAFFSKKIHMRWYWTLLCLVLCSGFILCSDVALQIGSVVTTLSNFLRQPLLLFLNLLPIVVVLVLLYALMGNALFAASITSLLFNILSLVNLIKIESRNDPLVPADIGLLKEAMQATGEYQLNLHVPYIIAIVLFSVLLFVAGIKVKSARPKALWRAGTGVLCVGCFVLAMATLYPSQTVYNTFLANTASVYEYNIPSVFDGLGFNYCFLRNFNLYTVDKPEGYSKEEVAAWADAAPGAGAAENRPNVIFIQCEAFSDIMADEVFTYAEEDNPLYKYQLVANSDRALSGHIVVSNYGAGTANTEFDIITGMQTNMISDTQTSAFRVIRKNTNSLARVYSAEGYRTYFMHPGWRWFYNRESVYDYLGISDTVFSGSFTDEDYKGNMVSDEAFQNQLIADFETRTADGEPLFAFTVTIQNHQAYPYSKYEGLQIAPAQVSVPLSDESMETLSVYAEGIRDSSEMLYELTQYFDTVSEPTLLVFWGDHLPALGNNFSVYQELGLDIGYNNTLEGTVNTYKTPFVIWANEAYCVQTDFSAQVAALDLPEDPLISDIYLGGIVYEMTGMTGADAYFDTVNQARRELPVICRGCYVLPDGSYTDTLTESQQALLDKLHKWEYYRLRDEAIG